MINFTGVFLTVENHGCVYTVCTEGELFSAPILANGSVNFNEFDIVDFWETDVDGEELEEIQAALIDMMQRTGLYFKKPVMVWWMTETNVNLNVHEIGIILSALQLLQNSDENRIAREYGSAMALYDKLSGIMDTMDTSQTGLRNDVVPSFWSIIGTSTQEEPTVITQENRDFVNFLFDKLVSHVDTDMIDLQDDDTCCDHVLFSQLELF